jgi:hypothetical protein
VTTVITGADYVTLIMPSGDTTGATDAQAIQNAIATAYNQGGGTVNLAGGLFYSTKITLPTGVKLRGSGRNATVLQLANSVNDNLIETTNFATLTGTDNTSTPYGFAVEAMTLDGNKNNQTGTSHCLAIYGYGYRLNEVTFRNARNFGLWSEWASAGPFLAPDGMEAFVTEVKMHDCDGGALSMQGPHDTQFINMIAVKNSGTSAGVAAVTIPTDGRANGSLFVGMHVYGGVYDYCLDLRSSGLTFVGCQFEGAAVAQAFVRASLNVFEGCKFFWGEAGANTTKGLILGDASHTNINSVRVFGKIENCSGAAMDLTYAASNFYDVDAVCVTGFTTPSPAVVGGFARNDVGRFTMINSAGTATSDSWAATPALSTYIGGIAVPSNVDQDPLGLGFATTHPWAAAANGTQAVYGVNVALYQQLIGYGMTTNQLQLYIGTSSGNISAGVYNNGSQAGTSRLPNSRLGTTGAIPCPAAGLATVTMTGSVTIPRGAYAAVSADNTTATFLRSAPTAATTNGYGATQGSGHPLPATAGAGNGNSTMVWMTTL